MAVEVAGVLVPVQPADVEYDRTDLVVYWLGTVVAVGGIPSGARVDPPVPTKAEVLARIHVLAATTCIMHHNIELDPDDYRTSRFR